MSLPKSFRLSSEGFDKVFQEGKRFHCFPFLILYTKNADSPRIGISLRKKFYKQAVVRNRIKRYLKQTYIESNQCMQSFDLVVLVKPGLPLTRTELRQCCQRLWQQFADYLQKSVSSS